MIDAVQEINKFFKLDISTVLFEASKLTVFLKGY